MAVVLSCLNNQDAAVSTQRFPVMASVLNHQSGSCSACARLGLFSPLPYPGPTLRVAVFCFRWRRLFTAASRSRSLMSGTLRP